MHEFLKSFLKNRVPKKGELLSYVKFQIFKLQFSMTFFFSLDLVTVGVYGFLPNFEIYLGEWKSLFELFRVKDLKASCLRAIATVFFLDNIVGNHGCPSQLRGSSINPTDPEVKLPDSPPEALLRLEQSYCKLQLCLCG